MGGYNKVHIQYAGKPMLFHGLITCSKCGCAVSGDIKKENTYTIVAVIQKVYVKRIGLEKKQS